MAANRRRLGGALAVALAVLAVAVPGATAATKIMLVGDSITQGSAGDVTWRYRLWRHLQATGAAVDFVGGRNYLYDNVADRQGATSYADPNFDRDHQALWGRALRDEKATVGAEVAAHAPDVVCVLLGTNDLSYFSSPAQAASDMGDLIAAVRARRPGTDIVLGHVPTRADVWNHTLELVEQSRAFNARLDGLATSSSTSASRVAVARVDAGWNPFAHTWDGTHPNATGDVRIAAAFADALATIGVGRAYGSRPGSVGWPLRSAAMRAAPTGARPGAIASPRAVGRDGAADLSWSASSNATGYMIRQQDSTAGRPEQQLPLAVAGTTFSPGLLTGSHLWSFRLVPVNDRGPVHLSWSAVAGATGYLIGQRDATAGAQFATLPYPVQGTSFDAGLLIADHRYEWRVQPVKGLMTGAASATAGAVPRVAGDISPAVTIRVKGNFGRRKTAVDFMERYAIPDATYYNTYGYADPDCTHFASEALLAAGWPEIGVNQGGHDAERWLDTTQWWRVNERHPIMAGSARPPGYPVVPPQRNATYTFTVARYLYDYLSGRAASGYAQRLSDPRDLDYGDLIQVDEEPDGRMNHTAVVTGFDTLGWPLYSQHSDNVKDRSLRLRQQERPTYRWVYWHLHDLDR